jgi:hypothetical protein
VGPISTPPTPGTSRIALMFLTPSGFSIIGNAISSPSGLSGQTSARAT